MSVLLLAAPVQAANNAATLSTKDCLQLIRDYWTEYEKKGVEPTQLFDKFGAQCESTKELDDLMLNDEYINAITARLAEKGIIN
jgi:hypothetical protein